MIKIATIEDEENIRQEIVRYIKKGIGSIEGVEVDVYESAERYLLVGGRYDLVISDIELPGISGLELGKRIKENNPDVYLVFLTSHSEFASESYIIEAYQYILKKDIEERLSPLIERVVHEIKKDYEEYRWVGTNQRKIKIYHKDIVCIQKIKGSKYAEYITEIEKTYCGKEIKTKVLKGVDLSISKGEFVCIFGESGSGKSTLLNILGLLDDATIGTYKLDGVDIRKLSKKESAFIRNQKIGFVFQAYHLIPELNALENLVVPLGYAGMRKKEREKIAYELLTEFGIDDLEKKHVSQMSGGEQQRIAIMRAIINKPQILLADEPTGNLDKENSQTIMNLFERLNKQGMTIVMVTHDTSLAKYGTRVVRVEDGRIIEKGKEILK